MLFVGTLHPTFKFVVRIINGSSVRNERFGLIQSLYYLFVLAYNLVTTYESHLVFLQLPTSYNVG